MQRRVFITTLFGALLSVGTAFAASYQDEIINQLAEQGFTRIKVSRTWLGRLRIVATNDRYQREIVINPNTGEILRDYVTDVSTGKPAANVSISSPPDPDDDGDEDNDDNGGSGSDDDDDDDRGGSGSRGDEDNDQDEDDDEEGDDDEDEEDDDDRDDDDEDDDQ